MIERGIEKEKEKRERTVALADGYWTMSTTCLTTSDRHQQLSVLMVRSAERNVRRHSLLSWQRYNTLLNADASAKE